jgi:hypothetical protein
MSDQPPVDTVPCRRCGAPKVVRKQCSECRLRTYRRHLDGAIRQTSRTSPVPLDWPQRVCARCGTLRYPAHKCRACEIAAGRTVGLSDPTEKTTPTQRKERATL